MKKVLLTTALAMIIAATASAQTVTLTGEVTSRIDYVGSTNQFDGPLIGWGDDDGIFLTFTGTGAGWDYKVVTNVLDGSIPGREIELHHDLFGSLFIEPFRIEWVRKMFGSTEVSFAFVPSHLEEFELALEGSVAGIGYDITAVNNANREFQAEVFAPISGVDFRLGMSGSLHDTSASSSFEYGVEIETNVLGVETQISMDEAGSVEARAEMGAFGVSVDLGDGDMFDRVGLEYTSNVTEQMEIHAEVFTDGTDTDAYAQLVLRF